MSSPANRTALREDENRPAPPGRQVIASAVTGPTPYSRAQSSLAPVRCRAVSTSRRRSSSRYPSRQAGMSRAVATCSCPAADRCAAAAARTAAAPFLVRGAPALSCGAPWRKKTAWMRCAHAVCPARRS